MCTSSREARRGRPNHVGHPGAAVTGRLAFGLRARSSRHAWIGQADSPANPPRSSTDPDWGLRHRRSWSRLPFPPILAGLHLISGLPMGKLDVRGVWRAPDCALRAIFGAVYAVLILTVAVPVSTINS